MPSTLATHGSAAGPYAPPGSSPVAAVGLGVGLVSLGVGAGLESIRQTFVADMQLPPHGIPFLQFRCALASDAMQRNAKTSRAFIAKSR